MKVRQKDVVRGVPRRTARAVQAGRRHMLRENGAKLSSHHSCRYIRRMNGAEAPFYGACLPAAVPWFLVIMLLAVVCFGGQSDGIGATVHPPAVPEAVSLDPLFQDLMVLQARKPVPVWGYARPGDEVVVRFSGQTKTAKTDSRGGWRVELDPMPHNAKDQSLVAEAPGSRVEIKRVAVGEVWIAAGGSNMAWPLDLAIAGDILPLDVKLSESAEDRGVKFEYFEGGWTNIPDLDSLTPLKTGTAEYFDRVLQPGSTKARVYRFRTYIHAPIFMPLELAVETPGAVRISVDNKLVLDKPVTSRPTVDRSLITLMHGYHPVTVIFMVSPGEKGPRIGYMPPNASHLDWNRPGVRFVNARYSSKGEGPASLAAKWEMLTVEALDVEKNRPSAVAMWFARELNERTGTPVGIWQGTAPKTPIQAWLKPGLKDAGKESGKAYTSLILPAQGMAIAGFLWYGGEENGSQGLLYREWNQRLIKQVRSDFGKGGEVIPFCQVEIAPVDNYRPGMEFLREAQRLVTAADPMAGTITISDCPKFRFWGLHPDRKEPVGKRMALWAGRHVYGIDSIHSDSPSTRMTMFDGSKAIVKWVDVGGGLEVRNPNSFCDYVEGEFIYPDGRVIADDDKELTYFMMAGEDRKFHPAHAVVVAPDTVVVTCDQVQKPAAVRFAYTQFAVPNLFSKEGLPAAPFRTDEWPSVFDGHPDRRDRFIEITKTWANEVIVWRSARAIIRNKALAEKYPKLYERKDIQHAVQELKKNPHAYRKLSGPDGEEYYPLIWFRPHCPSE